MLPRNDRVCNTLSPWIKGKGAAGYVNCYQCWLLNDIVVMASEASVVVECLLVVCRSSFQSISRKPLFEGSVTELVKTAHNPGRPRSACFVRMKSTITRYLHDRHCAPSLTAASLQCPKEQTYARRTWVRALYKASELQ